MNPGIKIVTIGGGSSYTPELIEGFIKRDKLLKAINRLATPARRKDIF